MKDRWSERDDSRTQSAFRVRRERGKCGEGSPEGSLKGRVFYPGGSIPARPSAEPARRQELAGISTARRIWVTLLGLAVLAVASHFDGAIPEFLPGFVEEALNETPIFLSRASRGTHRLVQDFEEIALHFFNDLQFFQLLLTGDRGKFPKELRDRLHGLDAGFRRLESVPFALDLNVFDSLVSESDELLVEQTALLCDRALVA